MKNTLFVGLTIFAISCGKKPESTFPTEGKITESIYASGSLKSEDQYQAFVTVNGVIDQIYIKEGDSVQVGTPLLSISNQAQKINTENAQLAVRFTDVEENKGRLTDLKNSIETTKSKFKLDSSLFSRQKTLWSQQIGTRIDLEQKELNFENSRANYLSSIQRYKDLKRQIDFSAAQSKKNLEISSSMQQDFTLKSKTSGVIFSLLKSKGEIVGPQTPIAIIGNPKSYVLELQVDENDIFKINQKMPVLITLDSYKNEVFEARITKISPIMNERSKTFLVEAKFVKAPAKLYPRMTFEANIILRTKEKGLLIPRNYLVGDSMATLLNGDKKIVKTGLKDFQKIEILSGLSVTDEIIRPK
jgi:multidrug efflux pump subunit AcrA (membrane-fusion protein)